MNKWKVVFFIFFLLISTTEARYVRKLKEPEFFIPEYDKMHKPEKLPKVKVASSTIKKEQKLKKIPDYKNKYNEYIADLAFFSKTKEMPENSKLIKDLEAMKEGSIFEISENVTQDITTKEQKDFYSLAAEILNN